MNKIFLLFVLQASAVTVGVSEISSREKEAFTSVSARQLAQGNSDVKRLSSEMAEQGCWLRFESAILAQATNRVREPAAYMLRVPSSCGHASQLSVTFQPDGAITDVTAKW